MKTKKRTRIISLLLAVVMAFSAVTTTITASAAYKPSYGDLATEEDSALMIEDVNTILDDTVLTGGTIESMYKFLPAIGAILNRGVSGKGSDTVDFYINYDAERWSGLADYVDEGTNAIVDDSENEDGTTVPGTFTKYFNDNPIVCDTQDDFLSELNYFVDVVMDQN